MGRALIVGARRGHVGWLGPSRIVSTFSRPPPQVEVTTDAAGEEEIELDDSPGAAWRLDVSRVPLVVTVAQVRESEGVGEGEGTGEGEGVGMYARVRALGWVWSCAVHWGYAGPGRRGLTS